MTLEYLEATFYAQVSAAGGTPVEKPQRGAVLDAVKPFMSWRGSGYPPS